MNFKEAAPRDAAAVILIRDDAVFLARRNPQLSFLGGWHAFPGGKVETEDAQIAVENCGDESLKKFIVAAARETFEEIGVLLVRGGEKMTKGQRASLHGDLTSGRFSFAEILENWGLRIDARDFDYAGFWTTPNFSPVRFKTRFFIAECPRRQEPQVFGEFVEGEFLQPKDALERWRNSEILISPPVLLTIQNLAEFGRDGEIERKGDGEGFSTANRSVFSGLSARAEKLLAESQKCAGEIRSIRLNSAITCFPVRTETLPPATHTNCFIVGGREFVVIDAGSPFEEEQNALHARVDSLIDAGNIIVELIISHLHGDHVSGVNALQKHLREKHDLRVPVAAHELTAEAVKDSIKVERFIEDGEVLNLKSDDGEIIRLTALHTPGHARGHLCFYDAERGFLLSGDNVVGADSVLIASPEGNMSDYLNSLERLKNLPNLRFLCGSHGAAIFDARKKIAGYIAHRTKREAEIKKALNDGAQNAREIVERVYADVSPPLWKAAEKSVEAHLEKISEDQKREK